MTSTKFSSLSLPESLLTNLESLGYTAMTPVQQQSLPPILTGKDVIAQAKTGSGKTAAFGLGLLAKLDVQRLSVQSLVLCPTRELADQVAKAIRDLARTLPNVKVLTLCGGAPYAPQATSLQFGAHIVVGTPGRIEDHLRKGSLQLEAANTLVLDEADRMLDMGFQETLDAILEYLPQQRQTLLFSATFPDEIQAIATSIMVEPVRVVVESTHDSATIRQHFYIVDNDEQRLTALRLLLAKFRPQSTLVFCTTRRETQEVADELRRHRFSTLALHGDLEQRDRDKTLVRFANKSASVLVATDVAARGLDIEALDAVINFQLSRDPEVHVHRIGRTGRAGSTGNAYSLVGENERFRLTRLEERFGITITPETLPPDYLLEKPAYKSAMATLLIDGGKKQKVRAGDILGALTGEDGIAGADVGKIDIFDNHAYVAVRRDVAKAALAKLTEDKLKGRNFRVRRLGS